MNELLKKLAAKSKLVAEYKAKKEAALAAANAEGVSPEDAAKRYAEFDRLDAESAPIKAEAESLQARVNKLHADADFLSVPVRDPVTGQPTNPNPPTGTRPTVPATPRRHGPLRAFKGQDAVLRAERAGMWAAAAMYGSSTAANWCRENSVPLVRGSLEDAPSRNATLNTIDNAKGGYFVPDEIDYTVAELALAYGVLRQFAEVVSMASGTKESPRWTGSMIGYWHGEGNKPTQSDPTWDLIKLVAKNLGAMTKMTRQLDEDSIVDLGDKVTMCIAEAFSYAEDNAGFNGDGTSAYGGIYGLIPKILAAAAAYKTAASGNVTPATTDVEDWLAVTGAFPAYPNAQPAWFMHKQTYALGPARLSLAAGGVTPADLAGGNRPTWLGYPVVFVNVMDSTPTAGEIAAVLGDLRLSTKLGDRRGRTVEVGFENDDFTKQLMTVLGTERVDVVNHTITDPRSSANAGPVVGLKLAGS